MDKIIKSTTAGICSFIFIYLIGAFCANSFNTATWSTEGRCMAGIFGAIFALCGFALTFAILSETKTTPKS